MHCKGRSFENLNKLPQNWRTWRNKHATFARLHLAHFLVMYTKDEAAGNQNFSILENYNLLPSFFLPVDDKLKGEDSYEPPAYSPPAPASYEPSYEPSFPTPYSPPEVPAYSEPPSYAPPTYASPSYGKTAVCLLF